MSEAKNKKPSRKQQILQALAALLEQTPGGRITTAALAEQVGVSEAALYRHFSSKAKMFDGLIEFIEESLFTRINQILEKEDKTPIRCQQILTLILMFCEKNPGITRILTGDPLAGETERLRTRVNHLFDRIETQLKQVLREMPMRGEGELNTDPTIVANLLLSTVEGRISQYVRSDFQRKPTEGWDEQWGLLRQML
ncbi:MAG: nucleoid occlusion factor SlmA [Pseudomonadales bacterium]